MNVPLYAMLFLYYIHLANNGLRTGLFLLYVLLSFIGSDNTNYHTNTIFKKFPIGRKQLFQYNQKKYIYYTIIIMCFVHTLLFGYISPTRSVSHSNAEINSQTNAAFTGTDAATLDVSCPGTSRLSRRPCPLGDRCS